MAGASLFPSINTSKRSLRLGYFTDIHLPNDPVIQQRAAKAVSKANGSDLVLFGGDNLMAIDHKDEATIQGQFSGWKKLLSENLQKPYKVIVGNHDVEQWESAPSPMNGKRRALDLFGMSGRYWSHSVAGWRIIGLDTVHQSGNSFMGWLDPEQLEWLRGELKDTKTPTVVLGHIPILTVTSLANSGLRAKENALPISFGSHVSNHYEAIKMFREAGNIKLVLSGHTHMQDRVDYAGTSYICAGAVCGGWWNGPNEGFRPAFAQIDLNSDGSFSHKFVNWED